MKAATLARIAVAQRQRQALVVVTRLADGAQCLVDAAGSSGDLALDAEQEAAARDLLASGRSAQLPAGCMQQVGWSTGLGQIAAQQRLWT